jgi:hypothetical protein
MAPTPHPCDDNTHGCESSRNGGICYKEAPGFFGGAFGGDPRAWSCACAEGFFCTKGCGAPFSQHSCSPVTKLPTVEPTASPRARPVPVPSPAPTLQPTSHPCDNGNHNCEIATAGGVCKKATAGWLTGTASGYNCECTDGYWCSGGCSAPYSGHTCTKKTGTPTAKPTRGIMDIQHHKTAAPTAAIISHHTKPDVQLQFHLPALTKETFTAVRTQLF